MSAAEEVQPAAILCAVTKIFCGGPQAVHALCGVDLRIDFRQLVMLAGPSGCGKTTLLSILSGLLTPTSGEVEVCGVDLSRQSEDQKTRFRAQTIGFVFQQFHLIPTLPIHLNVAVPLLARGVKYGEAVEHAAEILKQVGLGDRCSAMPSELSGGMQQRVAIARALVGQPRLLVCDEPTGNLDRETGESVMQMLHEVSRGEDEQGRPRSVIVVTHDYRALRFADLIYHMEDGLVQPASPELLMRVWQTAMIHHALPSNAQDGGSH